MEHIRHVEEFAELMNVLTNSKQFSGLPTMVKERGDKAMWTILFDEAEKRGELRGKRRGEQRGERRDEQRGERRGKIKGV